VFRVTWAHGFWKIHHNIWETVQDRNMLQLNTNTYNSMRPIEWHHYWWHDVEGHFCCGNLFFVSHMRYDISEMAEARVVTACIIYDMFRHNRKAHMPCNFNFSQTKDFSRWQRQSLRLNLGNGSSVIIATADWYELVCAPSNCVIFSDFGWPIGT